MKGTANFISAEQAGAALPWDMPMLAVSDSAYSVHSARHLKKMEDAAVAEGRESGHAEGYAAGAREAREHAQRLAQIIEHLHKPLAELDTQLEQQLIQLSVACARRLVGEELSLHPDKMAATVREAVAALPTQTRELRIHLSPPDVQLLRDTLALDTDASWKLVPDATLQRGDCRVINDNSRIDALLETRAAGLTRSLLGQDE